MLPSIVGPRLILSTDNIAQASVEWPYHIDYRCALCLHRIAQHGVKQQSVRQSQAAVIR